MLFFFFFFNDTATTEIYTLSLHDALPISDGAMAMLTTHAIVTLATYAAILWLVVLLGGGLRGFVLVDRKSTRLNSSHQIISYAVFCLKKKKIASRMEFFILLQHIHETMLD